MDFRQLRCFLSVAELGSLSKAAVMLGVGQPAISRYIRTLEEELGVELLYRNGRGIVLTDSGRVLERYAKSIVELASQAANEISSLRQVPTGRLIVGVPPSVGSVLIIPLVRQLKRECPKVTLEVIEGYSGHVLEWLSMGRIDIAVLYDAPKTSTLSTEPLIEEELFLIGPAAHEGRGFPEGTVEARVLPELPLCLPTVPHGLRNVLNAVYAKLGIELEPIFEIEALQACIKLAEDGTAYTVLPYAAVHQHVQEGKVSAWPIVGPRITRQLVLATATQRPMTLTTRTLARMIKAQVRELVVNGQWTPAKSSDLSSNPRAKLGEAIGANSTTDTLRP